MENVTYHAELEALAASLALPSATATNLVSALSVPKTVPIIFLRSVPSPLKRALLRTARLLVYTPAREHFGIVPLEAMRAGVPVLAADSGGPRETVVEGRTGWLRDPGHTEEWTGVMRNVIEEMSQANREDMGRHGKERATKEFSKEKMVASLETEIQRMVQEPRKGFDRLGNVLAAAGLLGAAVLLAATTSWYRQAL